jgi:hypothetical protein
LKAKGEIMDDIVQKLLERNDLEWKCQLHFDWHWLNARLNGFMYQICQYGPNKDVVLKIYGQTLPAEIKIIQKGTWRGRAPLEKLYVKADQYVKHKQKCHEAQSIKIILASLETL